VHEFGSDSTVDTTADCSNHSPLRSTDLTDARDFLADELLLVTTPETVSSVLLHSEHLITDHCPMRRTVADVKDELSNDFSPAWRVGDLRMELDTIPRLPVVGYGCEGSGRGMPDDVEVGWDFGELIPMGHPDLGNIQGESI
jgi:hypothetical protein